MKKFLLIILISILLFLLIFLSFNYIKENILKESTEPMQNSYEKEKSFQKENTCFDDSDCNNGEFCYNHNKCMEVTCGDCEYIGDHKCESYGCCGDSDCNDYDIETKDKCINPGTKDSFCQNIGTNPFISVVENSTIPSSKILSFIASNNPNDYLGDLVNYESPSDWRHYSPLVDEVNVLTSGLSSDREKVFAIGNWVKKSKPYNLQGSVANSFNGTIIGIFDADSGVCLDSADLTTAMLRLAGIPARAVARGLSHEQTEAYFDGRWYLLDPTFGSGDLYVAEEPDDVLRYIHEYAGFYDKDDTYYIFIKDIFKEGFGFLESPIVSQKKLENWYLNISGESFMPLDTPLSCRIKDTEENYVPAGGYYRVKAEYFPENFRDKSINFIPPSKFKKDSLPPGDYSLVCSILGGLFAEEDFYEVASADFKITSDRTTIIYADDFEKEPNAPQEAFEEFQNLMRLAE